MRNQSKSLQKINYILRAIIEMGFIIFLFYSNLLMGEFTHSNNKGGKSLIFAIKDIFTVPNFTIATITALIGYLIFEYLRKRIYFLFYSGE